MNLSLISNSKQRTLALELVYSFIKRTRHQIHLRVQKSLQYRNFHIVISTPKRYPLRQKSSPKFHHPISIPLTSCRKDNPTLSLPLTCANLHMIFLSPLERAPVHAHTHAAPCTISPARKCLLKINTATHYRDRKPVNKRGNKRARAKNCEQTLLLTLAPLIDRICQSVRKQGKKGHPNRISIM